MPPTSSPPRPTSAPAQPRILTIATVQADLDGRRLWVSGAHVPLSRRHFDVLAALMDNAGRVMTPDELSDLIAVRSRAPHSTAVRTYVKELRHALAAHPAVLSRLRTVRGVGYAFDLEP